VSGTGAAPLLRFVLTDFVSAPRDARSLLRL